MTRGERVGGLLLVSRELRAVGVSLGVSRNARWHFISWLLTLLHHVLDLTCMTYTQAIRIFPEISLEVIGTDQASWLPLKVKDDVTIVFDSSTVMSLSCLVKWLHQSEGLEYLR
jgi:hypothetical protein